MITIHPEKFIKWHISNTTDIPSRDIPIKGCSLEQGSHASNTADIPFRDIPIKG